MAIEFFNEVNILDNWVMARVTNLQTPNTLCSHDARRQPEKKKSPPDGATAPLKGTEADEPLALKEPESGTKSAAPYFVSDPPPHAVGPAVRAFLLFFFFRKRVDSNWPDKQTNRATCQVDFLSWKFITISRIG